MDIAYILSQIFTIIMYALLAVTYLLKSQRKIVLVGLVSLVANMAAFLLLGAWTGLAMCIVALFRNLYILWSEKRYGKSDKVTKRDYIFLGVVFVGIILAAIPTYEGALSLLSVVATVIYSYSIWQKSTLVYRFCGLPVGVLWVAYNAYVGSIFGVILEGILLIVSVWGYITELRHRKILA